MSTLLIDRGLTGREFDSRLRVLFSVVIACFIITATMRSIGETWEIVSAVGSMLAGLAAVGAAFVAGFQWFVQRHAAITKMAEKLDAFSDRFDQLESRMRESSAEHHRVASELQNVKVELNGLSVHSGSLAGDVRELKKDVRDLKNHTHDWHSVGRGSEQHGTERHGDRQEQNDRGRDGGRR